VLILSSKLRAKWSLREEGAKAPSKTRLVMKWRYSKSMFNVLGGAHQAFEQSSNPVLGIPTFG